MTCREKLKLEHPRMVDPKYIGGCNGCPKEYGYLEKPEYCDVNRAICTRCWDREIPNAEKKDLDIHKIIDDAIEKKDRTVSIFISKVGTTVSVSPIGEDPHWEITDSVSYPFKCSECGEVFGCASAYCPKCGEKLKRP